MTRWPGDLGCCRGSSCGAWLGYAHWGICSPGVGGGEPTGGASTPTMRTTCWAGHSPSPSWSVGHGSLPHSCSSPFPAGLGGWRETRSGQVPMSTWCPQGRGCFLLPRPWSPQGPNPYWVLSAEPFHPVKSLSSFRGGFPGPATGWEPCTGAWAVAAAQVFMGGASR